MGLRRRSWSDTALNWFWHSASGLLGWAGFWSSPRPAPLSKVPAHYRSSHIDLRRNGLEVILPSGTRFILPAQAFDEGGMEDLKRILIENHVSSVVIEYCLRHFHQTALTGHSSMAVTDFMIDVCNALVCGAEGSQQFVWQILSEGHGIAVRQSGEYYAVAPKDDALLEKMQKSADPMLQFQHDYTVCSAGDRVFVGDTDMRLCASEALRDWLNVNTDQTVLQRPDVKALMKNSGEFVSMDSVKSIVIRCRAESRAKREAGLADALDAGFQVISDAEVSSSDDEGAGVAPAL